MLTIPCSHRDVDKDLLSEAEQDTVRRMLGLPVPCNGWVLLGKSYPETMVLILFIW